MNLDGDAESARNARGGAGEDPHSDFMGIIYE